SVLVCQNLISDRICSTTVGIDICGVWLVHQVGHVLVVGPQPFQQCLSWGLPAILFPRRSVMDIGSCLPCFRPEISRQIGSELHRQSSWADYPPSSLAASHRLLSIWWARFFLDSLASDPVVPLLSQRFFIVPTDSTDVEVILRLNH